MQAAEPFIEVIIPNWNGKEMLHHCLQSLKQQSFSDFRVIVVDNGSTDGSVEMLESDYPFVKLLKFDYNSGFSVAVNAGIKEAVAPLLLLINNDMEVVSDCLENLAAKSEQYGDYDFFALKMMNFHNRDLIDGAGDAVLRGGVGYRLGTMEKDSGHYQEDRDVFGACAGAALYRREFFDKAGLFDEDFFAYLEDVDLNIRARFLGLRCMYLSDAVVFHIGSATSGSKINPLTIRLSTRNNINALLKNYPTSYFVRFAPAITVYQLMWFLFCCKKMMLLPMLQGVFEALRKRNTFLLKRRQLREKGDAVSYTQLADKIIVAEKEAVQSIINRREQEGKTSRLLQLYCRLF